jgi:hypothetical protein
MKTILRLVVMCLLVAVPSVCFGLMSIGPVSKEKAKELGVEVRVEGTGNEVWVTLELKKDSKLLKDFSHVSLEIREGEKLMVGYAPMQVESKDSGKTLRFMVGRDFLNKVYLRVVTGFPSNYSGNDLRVQEFVEAGKGPAKLVAPAREPATDEVINAPTEDAPAPPPAAKKP